MSSATGSPAEVAPEPAVLSDTEILREMEVGDVVISPFNRKSLSNCSYDVSLGDWFYRHSSHSPVFNPWNEKHVRQYWGEPQRARAPESDLEAESLGLPSRSVKFVSLAPGETILAHTREIIGGRHRVTTMMKARSSLGRACIAVCKCAGWGDVGYINRWTMEITNMSTTTTLVIPVGARVAQIVFLYCGVPTAEYKGKYLPEEAAATRAAPKDLVAALENKWSPESMLPKLWLDHDLVQ